MELTQLAIASPLFQQLEYDLQSHCKAATLKLVKAWEICNPALTVAFERRAKGITIKKSWLDCERDLSSPNSEIDVVRRGFELPSSQACGISFPIGPLDLSETQGKQVRRMMMCQVAIGRAFPAQSAAFLETETIPSGYDSIYWDPSESAIELTSLDFCHVSSPTGSSLAHTNSSLPIKAKNSQHLKDGNVAMFSVKNTAQALPRFVVEFEYDSKLERQSRQKATCENCEHELATVYCQADAALLCGRCDSEIHRSKLASRHHRMSLEKGPQCAVPCRSHPERIAEYFCPTCHVLVCLSCKMIGHHSAGDAVKHPLVAVTEAYQSVLESSQAPDPALEERRNIWMQHLEKLLQQGEHVLKHGKNVREQLDLLYKKAVLELEKLITDKLLILKGEAHAFKAIVSDMDRLKEYLSYLSSGRDATLFLLSWHQYLSAKADLPFQAASLGAQDGHTFIVASDAQPCFSVTGTLSVANATNGSDFSSLASTMPSTAHSLKNSTFSLTSPSPHDLHHLKSFRPPSLLRQASSTGKHGNAGPGVDPSSELTGRLSSTRLNNVSVN